jgi:lipopolysaccharide transport system ATP-binding protein
MTAAKSLCDRALLLDHGHPLKFGNPEEVTNLYLELVARKISEQSGGEVASSVQLTGKMHRHGTGEGRVRHVEVIPPDPIPFGTEVTFRFYLEYLSDVPESGIGFFIRDMYGNDILGINTFEEGKSLGNRRKGEQVVVEFQLPLHLRPGSYSISPGLSYDRTELRYLDWIDNAAFFVMEKPSGGQTVHGLVYIPNKVFIRTREDG